MAFKSNNDTSPSPSPSSPASPATSHDFASQIEEGRSPVSSSPVNDAGEERDTFDEKLNLKNAPTGKSRSSTFAANTIRSSTSAFQRAVSWSTSVGNKVRPNLSSSSAPCKVNKLEDYPLGYPRVSYLLDSDDSFMMYRRFGQLHSRLLLHKQDQLREMEEELLALDKKDDGLEDTRKYLRSREEDEFRDPPTRGRSRIELLGEIEKTLLEYGRILTQANQLQSLNKPSDRDHASISNYFHNEQPLAEVDRDFLYHKEDLATIRASREAAWLDAAVEGFLRWYPCRPVKVSYSNSILLSFAISVRFPLHEPTLTNPSVPLLLPRHHGQNPRQQHPLFHPVEDQLCRHLPHYHPHPRVVGGPHLGPLLPNSKPQDWRCRRRVHWCAARMHARFQLCAQSVYQGQAA